ncbi:MAG: DsbC family protein [Mariprofundaceae bacterium]
MRFLTIILIVLMSPAAWAADSHNVAPALAKQIRDNIPSLPIDAIHPSPIAGLYELQVGGQIFYADRTGKHLIASGHIFNTAERKDLTAQRLEEINTIDWSTLPLDTAIVSGDPQGLPIAIFTDPDCPYCKKLEQELTTISGIKVYTFLLPLEQLHPQSRQKSESIWCSDDQHQALLDVMLEDKKLPAATCETPISQIQALAKKLGISGTPTMISGDGRKYAGIKTAEQLKAWLQHQ